MRSHCSHYYETNNISIQYEGGELGHIGSLPHPHRHKVISHLKSAIFGEARYHHDRNSHLHIFSIHVRGFSLYKSLTIARRSRNWRIWLAHWLRYGNTLISSYLIFSHDIRIIKSPHLSRQLPVAVGDIFTRHISGGPGNHLKTRGNRQQWR